MAAEGRLRRLSELLKGALALPEASRADFVREQCADDEQLAIEVMDLLQRHRQAEGEQRTRPLPVPERIGAYEITGVLGRGGMGTVYLGRGDGPGDALVAIKTMAWHASDARAAARFESERDALALMSHPNVARLLGSGTTPEGLAYFVMEYVPGLPILRHVARHGTPLEQCLELVLQACAGVQHAHQKGVIHRDLKPSNILVTREEGRDVVKVIDFGIAKIAGLPPGGGLALTAEGQIVGTPQYMSPEQAAGSLDAIDTRTDVWALGVVLYELLTGMHPHERSELAAAGIDEMLRVIREEDPPRPSERLRSQATGSARSSVSRDDLPGHSDPATLRRRVTGDLDWIAMKALERERDRRYASVGDLAADLQRHLREEPVSAGPPSRVYRMRKFVRRHRPAVAAAILAALGLLAGTALATRARIEAQAARVRAQLVATEGEWARYSGALAVADGATAAWDVSTAKASLAAAPPTLRGWEWKHLSARADASIETLDTWKAPMIALAVSSDGRLGAVGDPRGVIRVLNLRTRAREMETKSPAGGPQGLVFVPGKPLLVAGGENGNLAIFDTESKRWVRTLEGHAARVRAVACDPAGSLIASASDDGTVRTWSVADGAPQRTFALEGALPWRLQFTPDGSTLLACTQSGTLEAWRTSDGKRLASLRANGIGLDSLAMQPDGMHAWMGGSDGTLLEVDLAQWRIVRQVRGEGATANVLELLPDGRLLVGFSNGAIQAWDTGSDASPVAFAGCEGPVTGLRALDGGGSFVSSSTDGALRLWPSTPALAERQIVIGEAVMALAFAGDQLVVGGATSGDKAIGARVFDAKSGKHLRDLVAGEVDALAMSSDGGQLAAGLADGTVHRFRADTWQELGTVGLAASPVLDAAFSHDGSVLYAHDSDGTLVAFDLAASRELFRRIGLDRDARVLALDPAGARLFVSTSARVLAELDARTGMTVRELPESGGLVSVARLSPDGHMLVTGLLSGGIEAWRLPEARPEAAFQTHAGGLRGLAFSPDGSRIVSVGFDRTLRWYDPAFRPLVALRGHAKQVTCVAFSADGTRLATGSFDGSVVVRDSLACRQRLLTSSDGP